MSDVTGPAMKGERFEPRPESVRDARRFVVRTLADTGSVADDAALLVSELATNAVIHAGSAYTVTVRRDGHVVRVEVADASPASARRCHYSATSGTGRGLGMVEDLASGWGVEELDSGDGKVVWFELPLPDEGDAAGVGVDAADADDGPRAPADDAATDADLDALLAELGGWDDDEGASGDASPSALLVVR